jgi:hypothetical protein
MEISLPSIPLRATHKLISSLSSSGLENKYKTVHKINVHFQLAWKNKFLKEFVFLVPPRRNTTDVVSVTGSTQSVLFG